MPTPNLTPTALSPPWRPLYVSGSLKVEVEETWWQLLMTLTGRSDARDPSDFLEPLLISAGERSVAGSKRLVLDFRKLEAMNSSTVGPILRAIERARRVPKAQLTVRYDHTLRWQTITFSVLKAFETGDGRIQILPK